MITGIDHVNIVVSDLEKAAGFFTALGFAATEPAELSGEWISKIVGLRGVQARYVVISHPAARTTIELIHYQTPPSSAADPQIGMPNRIGFRHLAFPVTDIEAEVQRLKALGVQFISGVHVYPKTGKKLAYFYGPEGILLELAEYPR